MSNFSGVAVCICQRKCPERNHPVCGSDGVAYENHCELHREACIQGSLKIFDNICNTDQYNYNKYFALYLT